MSLNPSPINADMQKKHNEAEKSINIIFLLKSAKPFLFVRIRKTPIGNSSRDSNRNNRDRPMNNPAQIGYRHFVLELDFININIPRHEKTI